MIFMFTADAWYGYINPENGIYKEGDIVPIGRRQVLRPHSHLWGEGVVYYYIHPSISKTFLQF
jgi:hypothetical protein